jgi:type II secretory pathway pseudopilin PulG
MDSPTTPAQRPPRSSRRAFTLAESLIAAAVLAIATIGVITLVNSAAAQANAVRQDTTALSLARELLEMTAAVSFAQPFPDGPGFDDGNVDPTTYDDVLDFNGYTDRVTPGSGEAGDVRAYERTVAVSLTAGPTSSSNCRLVTVTVTPPRGRPVALHRLITVAEPTREGT